VSGETLAVAFLGLGAMGLPMAERLLASGFRLRVYNRTKGPDRALAERGATACATPAEAARGADVVVTMLADAAALREVLEATEGVLATFAAEHRDPAPVLVDMATIGRRAALETAARAEAHGARFVDAPVSGSVGPASRGELVALAGGSPDALSHARPILEALCRKIVHAGSVGQGQALKVVLNGLGAHHLVAFASMLALGERAGLGREILLQAFTEGAFATPSYVGKRAKVAAKDYSPEFALALALKDCALNVELQDEVGLALPVHRAIVAAVAEGVQKGLGDLDLFALEELYSEGRR
jgi:3-hydroxyisobutyrate dehydrogenase